MKRIVVGFILLFICAVVVVIQFQIDFGHHTSKSALIWNRLRAIDGAKERWAAERPDAKGGDPVEQDLAPYLQQLHHYTFFSDGPVAGEKYSINSLGEPAQAQLAKRVVEFPENSSVRVGSDGSIQVRTNGSLPWHNLSPEPSAVDRGSSAARSSSQFGRGSGHGH